MKFHHTFIIFSGFLVKFVKWMLFYVDRPKRKVGKRLKQILHRKVEVTLPAYNLFRSFRVKYINFLLYVCNYIQNHDNLSIPAVVFSYEHNILYWCRTRTLNTYEKSFEFIIIITFCRNWTNATTDVFFVTVNSKKTKKKELQQ